MSDKVDSFKPCGQEFIAERLRAKYDGNTEYIAQLPLSKHLSDKSTSVNTDRLQRNVADSHPRRVYRVYGWH